MKSRKQKAEGRNVLVLLILLVLIGCETREHADAELGALKKAKDAAARASARAAEPIGIAECDDYIEKYEACLIDKVPDEQRADLRRTLNEQRSKWHDAMSSGQDQAAIAEQCKSAASDALAKLGSYGCTF